MWFDKLIFLHTIENCSVEQYLIEHNDSISSDIHAINAFSYWVLNYYRFC